jgi:hypothetical protein
MFVCGLGLLSRKGLWFSPVQRHKHISAELTASGASGEGMIAEASMLSLDTCASCLWLELGLLLRQGV